MQEKVNRRSEEKKKKDYYTPVMLCQIACAILIFLIYFFFIASSHSIKNEFHNLFSEEIFDTAGVFSVLKQYLNEDGAWAVSGNSVVYADKGEVSDEVTNTPEPGGTGGDDMTAFEAAANTSFAQLRATTPAVRPVDAGRYTSYFGYRINPITDEFSFHTGLDIAVPEGSKIKAAYSGFVSKVGEDSRAGKYIFLTHDDGFVTFYCHCSEILAQEGAVIRQGETIARVGSTGWSTGPHLHFEIRKNNIRYNPIFILENDN